MLQSQYCLALKTQLQLSFQAIKDLHPVQIESEKVEPSRFIKQISESDLSGVFGDNSFSIYGECRGILKYEICIN